MKMKLAKELQVTTRSLETLAVFQDKFCLLL